MGLLKNIKAALFPADADPDGPPAWTSRLKDAKYTSAKNVSFEYKYLDLSSFIPIKSSVFTSVDGDGAYVQHNGVGGMRFPMLMLITGADNDQGAKTALKALTEAGDGTLNHPVFGAVNVGITGEIEQINAFVTAANQTSFVVEFVETTGIQIDGLPPFASSLDAYLENAAQSFADTVSVADKAEEISLATKVTDSIGKVKVMTDRVSAGIEETQSAIDDTFDSINLAIDTLVKDPLMLARQVQYLVMTPAREVALIKDKLEAYKNLALDIFGANSNPKPNLYDSAPKNDYAVDSLISGALVAGMTQLSQNNDFEYQKDLIFAADSNAETSETYIAWADNGAESLSFTTGGGTVTVVTNNSGDWSDLNNTVAIANKNLLQQVNKNRSTSERGAVKTEIKVTTTRRRSMMAWCFEFYGSVKPGVLNRFRRENDLGGDELFYIETNRELVYYV